MAFNSRTDHMQNVLTGEVRAYWKREPCGTGSEVTDGSAHGSLAWFQEMEAYRYRMEPFIHAVAQFTRQCHGVDLTDAAIETTRRHRELSGFESDLKRANAEELPFADGSSDPVYSRGLIHHAERPERWGWLIALNARR